ncbi:unnamed protein product [Pylaiella littoralis]
MWLLRRAASPIAFVEFQHLKSCPTRGQRQPPVRFGECTALSRALSDSLSNKNIYLILPSLPNITACMALLEHGPGVAPANAAVMGTSLSVGLSLKVSPLTKLSTAASCVPGEGGVLTVSDDTSCTHASLMARENSLAQAAEGLVRNSREKRAATAAGGELSPDAGKVEAEIATLELLNQRDTMLCDDLRAACRIGATTRAGGRGGGGGAQRAKLSCWALVQDIGFSKKALLPSPPGKASSPSPPAKALSPSPPEEAISPSLPEEALPPSPPKEALSRSPPNEKRGAPTQTTERENEEGTPEKRLFSKYDEETTSILTEWFLSHKRWPYPAPKEKDTLAEATNLTTLQISNWFTNKRKRHWTPVIKKRIRSPRDFFEFCVMNPKDQPLTEKSPVQQQSPQRASTPTGGVEPRSIAEVAQGGTNNDETQIPASGTNHDAARSGPSVSHEGQSAMPLDTQPPGPQQSLQQQLGPQQRRSVALHPGALAPGLVYASQAALQATNVNPSIRAPHEFWATPSAGMDRRRSSIVFPHGGLGNPQQSGPPLPSIPQQAADPRGASRAPQHADVRGFDANSSAFHQAQQNHEALRRRTQISGVSPPASQHGPNQQQGANQQQQHQQPTAQRQMGQQYPTPMGQKKQRVPNPEGLPATRAAWAAVPPTPAQKAAGQRVPNPEGLPTTRAAWAAVPPTPAQQAAGSAHSTCTLWASHCPPSPRRFAGPPTFPQRVNGGGGGDHAQYSPGLFCPKGAEAASYSSARLKANASGVGSLGGGNGYSAWCESSSSAKPDPFPRVAAFVASGGAGAGAAGSGATFAVKGVVPGGGSGGGGTGISQRPGDPPHLSPDARGPLHHPYLPQQQQQYWDLSMTGRAWPAVGAGGVPIPPPHHPITFGSDCSRGPPSLSPATG